MNTSCPHCGQSLEGDDSLAGTTVSCPDCGQPFVIPDAPARDGTGAPESELDGANHFLERMIGNVAHAILGIFRRTWQVARFLVRGVLDVVAWLIRRVADALRFVFSVRFARFLALVSVLIALLAVLGGIVAAPFVAWLWAFRSPPEDVPVPPAGIVDPDSRWWLFQAGDATMNGAVLVEAVWLVLFAGWGILAGIKSYRRGVLSRWRARRKEKRAARRAAKRAAKEAGAKPGV